MIDVTATLISTAAIIPPQEIVAGSCGPFHYEIIPNPGFFKIVDGNIQVQSGFDPTIYTGTQTFLLTANYLNFPNVLIETQFTVEFTNTGCQQNPDVNIYVPRLEYIKGRPATIAPVKFPIKDMCGNFIVMDNNAKQWIRIEPSTVSVD